MAIILSHLVIFAAGLVNKPKPWVLKSIQASLQQLSCIMRMVVCAGLLLVIWASAKMARRPMATCREWTSSGNKQFLLKGAAATSPKDYLILLGYVKAKTHRLLLLALKNCGILSLKNQSRELSGILLAGHWQQTPMAARSYII